MFWSLLRCRKQLKNGNLNKHLNVDQERLAANLEQNILKLS